MVKVINPHDREILVDLAHRVADLASRPVEAHKRLLWHAHNRLEQTRPLVFCDPENGWNEIIRPHDLLCQENLARQWELTLRKEIFWGESLQDDRVIQSFFDVSHIYSETDWGMHETRIGGEDGGAYTWEPPLKSYEMMSILRFPKIEIDQQTTDLVLEQAHEIFDGFLTVRLKTNWWWTLGLTWTLVNLRGLEQMMIDMIEQPEKLHKLMAFLRDGTMARLDFLEQNNLLSLNNDGSYVGSGGFGWTDELPQQDFSGAIRTKDLWGFAESQETVGISPAMFAEFVFPYQKVLLDRFGLNCYGCCEPLDKRWHVVKNFPRLRRISVSAWANVDLMAEYLGSSYIFSWKPTPTDLAVPTFDEETIRKKIRQALNSLRRRNCCVEIIMKDNHTIANDPKRVIRWVKIAKEEAES